MKDKVLIFGSQGLLGQELVKTFKNQSWETLALDRTWDLGDFPKLRNLFQEFKPTVVLNPAGFTQVDKAEEQPEVAWTANVEGPKNLALLAEDHHCHLVHFSTDYVFDGLSCRAYLEDDLAEPLGVYGRSKLAGETLVLQNCTRSWVLRVSWLYGEGKKNFLSTMMEHHEAEKEISVAVDQTSVPNWTRAIAENLMQALVQAREERGLFHFVAQGQATRYEWIEKALGTKVGLKPATKDDFPSKAKRPTYSALASRKSSKDLGVRWDAWDVYLEKYLKLRNKS